MPLRLIVFCVLAGISQAHALDAVSLRERHTALQAELASNQFQRQLYLVSSEDAGDLKGDIYAVIDQRYTVVGPSLQSMDSWCDILILHLNVKNCSTSTPEAGNTLSLNIGRKYDQPLADEYLFDFIFKVTDVTPDYLQVVLNAEQGPLGTRDYRVVFEVVALDAEHSFLHLSYSYNYGAMARAAAQGYLATVGRNKVGFSIVNRTASGEPVYIRSVRGVIERNTMRYYLAIEAYLGALSTPAPEQSEKRLNDWFAGIERYPVQLHELERDEYLSIKRKEIRRRQSPGLATVTR